MRRIRVSAGVMLVMTGVFVVPSGWRRGTPNGGHLMPSHGLEAAQQAASDQVTPYRINVPEAVLTDLKDRLARTRFPSEIEGSGWDYGTNLAYLKELVTYWRTASTGASRSRSSISCRSSRPRSTASRFISSTSDRAIPTPRR